MKRLLRSLLIALPISVVVTVLLGLASGFAGGACHCMTPVSIFFPYGTFITMRTSWEAIGGFAIIFQFPLYATIIAVMNGRHNRLIAAFVLLVVHAIAAMGAVTMYQWWK
jgi:hypothetical protein